MVKIRILIVDDHNIFAEGLATILGENLDYEVIGTARNGLIALKLLESKEADLVLLDISMPEMDGYSTAKQLKSMHPQTKILVLTMHSKIGKIVPFMDLGIHGYTLKNSSSSELSRAIKDVMNNRVYLHEDIRNIINEYKSSPSKKVTLSDRENEILQLLYLGLSTNSISERLFLSPRTVETHRRNILSKTDSSNTAQLLHYALKNGLID